MTEKKHIEVRPFEQKDYHDVVEIIRLSFQSKFSSVTNLPGLELKWLMMDALIFDDTPQEGYFVATLDGDVVGVVKTTYAHKRKVKKSKSSSFLYLIRKYGLRNVWRIRFADLLLSDKPHPGDYYIEHIAVSESARGHGIGTMLFEKVIEDAQHIAGIRNVTLYVAGTNQGAINLYQRLNFRILKNRKSWLHHLVFKNRVWYFMALPLKNQAKPRLTWSVNWWFGFFGLIGFIWTVPMLESLSGGKNYWVLLNALWFLWFSYFIPAKRY